MITSKRHHIHKGRPLSGRTDYLVDELKSILDDKYHKKDHQIFNRDYKYPGPQNLNEAPYYDPSQESLERTLVSLNDIDGPIFVHDQSLIRDTQFDPHNGIPRPPHNYDDNYSRHYNDKDPLPYYDPIGDQRNIIRPDDKDSLIWAVPINLQETLNVDNTLAEIEQQKRLIRKPSIYYDPTVLDRQEPDKMAEAIAEDRKRLAEPPAVELSKTLKQEAAKAAAILNILGNQQPEYIAGWPDYKQIKVATNAHDRREAIRTGKFDKKFYGDGGAKAKNDAANPNDVAAQQQREAEQAAQAQALADQQAAAQAEAQAAAQAAAEAEQARQAAEAEAARIAEEQRLAAERAAAEQQNPTNNDPEPPIDVQTARLVSSTLSNEMSDDAVAQASEALIAAYSTEQKAIQSTRRR